MKNISLRSHGGHVRVSCSEVAQERGSPLSHL